MTQQLTYFKAVKLLLSILLTTSLFAQDKNNQILYTIETTTEYYNNVSIDSVYGSWVKIYERGLNTTLNIPIAEIKNLKQNGLKSDPQATVIGTLAGGFVGSIVVAASPKFFQKYWDQPYIRGIAYLIVGGGAILGYKLGSNIFRIEYKVVEFEGWTLDEKRNHLNSIVNQ